MVNKRIRVILRMKNEHTHKFPFVSWYDYLDINPNNIICFTVHI